MVTLVHPNGNKKNCPIGFSWTTLLMGPFVLVFRGWFSMLPLYLGGSFLTFGIFALVMPFQINRYWISYLIDRGYKPSSVQDWSAVAAMGLPDETLPHWSGSLIRTFSAGERVPYGLYVALNAFDYRFVSEENAALEGLVGIEYFRMPIPVTLALLPVLGAVFYFAFPLLVIGFVAFAMFKLILRPLQSLVMRKAHWANLHWDPVMAYMKRPEDKKKAKDTEKKLEEETQKNTQDPVKK